MTVCLAWKREDVWQVNYDESHPAWQNTEGRLTRIDDLRVPTGGVLVADRAFLDSAAGRGLLPGVETCEAVFHPVGVIRAAAWCDAVSPEALLPLYPREPEAVTKWEALKRRDAGG